jgi:uncharacterized Zn finger protein
MQEKIEPKSKRNLASSFWGKNWCFNLSFYEDMPQRLQKGRTLLRKGTLSHLKIEGSRVTARCRDGYEIAIRFLPIDIEAFEEFARQSVGRIRSLEELLLGRFDSDFMEWILKDGLGLFPGRNEIRGQCTCLDEADLCSHQAGLLYALAERFDDDPGLFFRLRQMPMEKLLASLAGSGTTSDWDGEEMEKLFGIELI